MHTLDNISQHYIHILLMTPVALQSKSSTEKKQELWSNISDSIYFTVTSEKPHNKKNNICLQDQVFFKSFVNKQMTALDCLQDHIWIHNIYSYEERGAAPGCSSVEQFSDCLKVGWQHSLCIRNALLVNMMK